MKVKTQLKAGSDPFNPPKTYGEGYHDAAILCSSNCECADGFVFY